MSEQWFRSSIISGLQGLLVLSLPRTPAADNMRNVAAVWIKVLWPRKAWRSDDSGRIEQAFSCLAAEVHEWPSPSQFLERLPARSQQAQLPPPAMTLESSRYGKSILTDLISSVEKNISAKRQGGGHE
jgi:hypothetical protein